MKTVVITGASSGIGKETALFFSKKGWKVVACIRDITQCSDLENTPNIYLCKLDVKDKLSISACLNEAISKLGKVDVFINNAGVYTTAPLECTSEKDIENIINTNIKGVLYTTKAILPHFRQNGEGTIINISSISGCITFPYQTVYQTSKWAIEGFSESLYYELKPFNIYVKLVEPGVVKTNIYRSVSEIPTKTYPTEYRNRFNSWYNCLIRHIKNGYSPKLEAKTIYRAANDKNHKLRYRSDAKTKFILAMRSLLHLTVFRNIISWQTGINKNNF